LIITLFLRDRVPLGKELIPGKIGLCLFENGLIVRQLRLRLIERDTIIAVVNAHDHVAAGDMLIVGDGHGGDVARNLWRDRKLPRRDEGIVCRFEVAGIVPIDIGCWRRHNKEKKPNRKHAPPQETPARLICAFAILLGFPIAVQWRQIHDFALAGGVFRRRHSGTDEVLSRIGGGLAITDHA